MTRRAQLLLLFCYLCISLGQSTPINSFVVTSTEPSKEKSSNKKNNEITDVTLGPQITKMEINSNVCNRFSTTLITSKVKNPANFAQQATFSVILPESAYISKFVMEIGGKSYEAYVKKKEEAKQIYNQAVASGRSAAHVAVNARDSNRFTVSVNVEAEGKAIFYLTYEELLQRKQSQYEVIINIHPGQILKNLDIKVHVNESRPLKFIKTPALRSGNEVFKNDQELEPNTDITIINGTSAVVTFSPDAEQQRHFAEKLGKKKENGLSGQFVVQYDVERDPTDGEVLLNDGYFVHFFAPSDLPVLPKQVVFVLDMSGSMTGLKMEKLKSAMDSILPELKNDDMFSIIAFDDLIRVYDIANKNITTFYTSSEHLQLKESRFRYSFPANEQNIRNAKDMVKELGGLGLTNIMGGLETAIYLIQRENIYQPMIIFLTDGDANVGKSSPTEIIDEVQRLTGDNKIPIFSLSFGEGANRDFLKKLSLKNLGFSRHIYDAADADLQLKNFYKEISSPLLNNVTFEYVNDDVKEVTKTKFPIYFAGDEIIVAGKYQQPDYDIEIGFTPEIWGNSKSGRISLPSERKTSAGNLERLWAYLTVKQKLEDSKAAENATVLEEEALNIALKYSFVTPVSSLVVVKPNNTDSAVNTEDASKVHENPMSAPRYSAMSGQPGYAHRGAHGYSGGYNDAVSLRGGSSPTLSLSHISPRTGGGVWYTPRRLIVPQPRVDYTRTTTYTPSTTLSTVISIEDLKSRLPWLESILGANNTITFKGDNYDLGLGEVSSPGRNCTIASTGDPGECRLLHECRRAFYQLRDINDYENYFCTFETYAGICCPLLRM